MHFSSFLFLLVFPSPRHYLIPYRGFGKSLYDYTLTKWVGRIIIFPPKVDIKMRTENFRQKCHEKNTLLSMPGTVKTGIHPAFETFLVRYKSLVWKENIFSHFQFYIFLIWRGGRAISLMESDRILLCLMKFWLKNETQKLRLLLPKQQSQ